MNRERKLVRTKALELLALDPDPVPRHLILRDVLRLPPDSRELDQARAAILENPWVTHLIENQYPDGGWGRFHSGDIKRKPFCTRVMAQRALDLGLGPDDEVLRRCVDYLAKLYHGEIPWPVEERQETNERWPIYTRVEMAGVMSKLRPDHEIVLREFDLWREIDRRATITGTFDAVAQHEAIIELTGTRQFRGRPPVIRKTLPILGAHVSRLGTDLERALFERAWTKGWGAYPDMSVVPEAKKLERWFGFQDTFSLFPSWRLAFGVVAERLWAAADADGLWDFGGPATRKFNTWMLSASWRQEVNRKIDHSTRVLLLLARYHQ